MALSDFFSPTEHRSNESGPFAAKRFAMFAASPRGVFSPKSPGLSFEEPLMTKQSSFSLELPLSEPMLAAVPSLSADEPLLPLPPVLDEEFAAFGVGKDLHGLGLSALDVPDDVHHGDLPPELDMSDPNAFNAFQLEFALSPHAYAGASGAFLQSFALPPSPAHVRMPAHVVSVAPPAAPLMSAAIANINAPVPARAVPATLPVKRKRGRPPGSKNKPKPPSAAPKAKKPRVRFVSAADLGVGREDEFVEVPMTSSSNRRARPIFVPGQPLSPTPPQVPKPKIKAKKAPKVQQEKDLATQVALFLVAAHETGLPLEQLATQISGYSAEMAHAVQNAHALNF